MSWFFLGFLIAAPLFFQVGFYGNKILDYLKSIKEKITKKPEPEKPATVTLGAYQPPRAGFQSSQIVTPKTPRQLEYEAKNAVLRENGMSN